MRKPPRFWYVAAFGGAAVAVASTGGHPTWPWVAVLSAGAAGCIWEALHYCRRRPDPRGGCPRPVPPPLIRVADFEFEREARLGSGMPTGHPEWVSGLVSPEWHERLERLWESTWPNAEYLGLIEGGPDE